jgi:hypothetical protein
MTTDQIVWTLAINIVSILIGGGLIGLWIDWKRHQREVRKWQHEDQTVEIDVPRAEMRVSKWQITEDTLEDEELLIHRNQLQDTIQQLTVVGHFVIRNTTSTEIVVTDYTANILQIPPGPRNLRFYDLETKDLISVEDVGPIKLHPHAAIPRMLILSERFGADRRQEAVPATLSIEVTTSSGKKVQGNATLNIITRMPSDVEAYQGVFHPKKYLEKIRPAEEEDDIPF